MPAYLSQIAAAATAAPDKSRGLLSPAIRSRSPIAERDQRLTLTDTDWNFEDALREGDTAAPPLHREESEPGPHQLVSAQASVSISPSGEGALSKPQDLRRPARPEPTGVDGTPGQSAVEFSAAAVESNASVPEHSLKKMEAPSPVSPGRTLPRAEVSTVEPAFSGQQGTDRPEQRPARATQLRRPSTNARAESISTMGRAPSSDTAAKPPRELATIPRSEVRSPEFPLPNSQATPREPGALPASPDPGRSGVFIDRIEVEVVPPPTEHAAPKPAPRPTPAPISQIGPLRGVAKHLAFSLRCR